VRVLKTDCSIGKSPVITGISIKPALTLFR
jgi:hypothetical protein